MESDDQIGMPGIETRNALGALLLGTCFSSFIFTSNSLIQICRHIKPPKNLGACIIVHHTILKMCKFSVEETTMYSS